MIRLGNYPAAAAQLSELLKTLPNEEVVKSIVNLGEQLKRPPVVVPRSAPAPARDLEARAGIEPACKDLQSSA